MNHESKMIVQLLKRTLPVVTLALLSATPAVAITNLTITVAGTNIVLSWPSVPGETYSVWYTPSLDADIQWSVLSANLSAATGTNTTVFVHEGVIPENPPAGGGGGGGGAPPAPGGASALSSSEGSEVRTPWWERWTLEDREPYSWELEKRPPYPWEADAYKSAVGEQMVAMSEASSLENPVSTGFYQVKGVRVMGGLTNGTTLSGFRDISITTDADATFVRLLVDGKSFRGADILAPPFSNPFFLDSVDSGRLTNGPHTFQVEAVWELPALFDGGAVSAMSAPFSLNVSNELSFPDWVDDTGDTVNSFYVTSAHPVADWEIDIYNYWEYLDWLDGVIPTIDPIHVKTGSTTNGRIVYQWNLIDDFGQLRTNDQIDPFFISFTYTAWQNGGGLGAIAQATGNASRGNPPQRQSAPWPEHGNWIVSYQDSIRNAYDANGLMTEMFNGWLGIAGLPDGLGGESLPVFYQTPVGGTNGQTFPLRHNYYKGHRLYSSDPTFTTSIKHDNELLRRMILDSRARNFYYSGHGSPIKIGNGDITALQIQNSAGKHRYRFVFLDGCKTASGLWESAFGINGPGVFSLDYYRERTRRPNLFAGYAEDIPFAKFPSVTINGVVYDGTIPEHVAYFQTQFQFSWYYLNRTFAEAIEEAKDDIRQLGDSGLIYLNVNSSKFGQRYQPGNDLMWTGYDDMRFNEFNRKGEIPHP